MTVNLSALAGAGQQFFTDTGVPLSGGKLYSYAAGTTTPQATYTTAAGTIAHANPIILDSAGRISTGEIWLTAGSNYKFVLKTSLDVTLATWDNITGINGTGIASNASNVQYDPAGTGAVSTTVQAKLRQTVSVKDFGAIGNGVADDTTAIQNAITSLSGAGGSILFPYGTYKIISAITLTSNLDLVGDGKPTLNSTVAGQNIFSGNATNNVSITNLKFNGTGSATTPLNSVGGNAATSTGLVTIVSATDITISQCEFGNFYNGLSLLNVQRAQVTNNYVHDWLVYGILGSLSDNLSVDYNKIIGCDQTGASNAYGVMITGNTAGGNPSSANSISFNTIWDIPSWDGIMTHDCDALKIVGNDIRNVRCGIDASSVTGATIDNVQIANNYIKGTTTDTWSGTGAFMAGILFQGSSVSTLAGSVNIIGNIIDSFFQMTGSPTYAGNPGHISGGLCEYINIVGNTIQNAGQVGSTAPGIYISGQTDRININGNTVQGTMSAGVIRFASVSSGKVVSIVGNTLEQTTLSDRGVYITNSVMENLVVEGNAFNSEYDYRYSASGNTITFSSVNTGSIQSLQTYTVSSIANGTSTTLADFAVPGARDGDTVVAFTSATGGIYFSGFVPGADLVRITFLNQSGITISVTNSPIVINVIKYR